MKYFVSYEVEVKIGTFGKPQLVPGNGFWSLDKMTEANIDKIKWAIKDELEKRPEWIVFGVVIKFFAPVEGD